MTTAVQQALDDSIGLRTCKRCKETQPETNFEEARGKRGQRYRSRTCNACRNERRREVRKSSRRRIAETTDERLTRKLWEEYRITREQYEGMIRAQDNRCAICRSAPPEGKRLHIDHCHTTGIVRGLLCNTCNVAVGFFEKYGTAAAQYLAAYGDGNPLVKRSPDLAQAA
ncbi:endonuclease domain-containing protein [Streptomyces sp. NBC_01728]|uniref:endonuclease VII domain-containing protein n=1 Tax=unclassified Streptomyces TaxID=2593676 RepID=UPI0022542B8F|nr:MULTISPECIES: endonuclease VII domain-containing protein [unclassified Streptomyces]MCX4458503.1 endonuclease domain-containing protein [Streptomyces sp. NBC_01719]MCX4497860.1 endonuclease domain-containing protein [Streptomyces sp. NBC_01728]